MCNAGQNIPPPGTFPRREDPLNGSGLAEKQSAHVIQSNWQKNIFHWRVVDVKLPSRISKSRRIKRVVTREPWRIFPPLSRNSSHAVARVNCWRGDASELERRARGVDVRVEREKYEYDSIGRRGWVRVSFPVKEWLFAGVISDQENF